VIRGIPLDISDFPTRHNYGLELWQSHFEPILADWAGELGVPILRGCEVVGFAQDDTGVDVELSDDRSLRAEYLVGCDGGRSVIRKAAGIEFPGWDPTRSWLIAEVEMAEEPEFGLREGGGIGRAANAGLVRVALTEQHLEHTREPTLQDLSEALVAVDGTDHGVHSPTWISRFTDMNRQAASYRRGRVLLAGDAAHVHPPFTTTSVRDTPCSGAACPISTWCPPTARCGCSPCCTMPGRCCSTSARPAASTSRRGRIASA